MGKIAICDDNLEEVQQLVVYIKAWLDRNRLEEELLVYQTGEEMLQNAEGFQVAFLDIDMPKMDGIALGEEIHRKNPKCVIIMETGMDARVREAFKIGALRSLSKPYVEEDVGEALRTAFDRFLGENLIQVYFRRSPYEIREKEIRYIRAINGQVEIFAEGRVYRKASTLEQMLSDLDERIFFQISRSYVVNLQYVSVEKDGYLSVGKEHLRISRSRKKLFLDTYMIYEARYK